MHGLRQPGDPLVAGARGYRLGYGVDDLGRGLAAIAGHLDGDGRVGRGGIAVRTEPRIRIIRLDRQLSLRLDLGIREIQCGIIGSLSLVADDLAVVQLDDALAHRVDDLLVVRGHHDGGAGAVDGVQHLHDAQRRSRVEVAGGLVGQQDLRMVHVGAGDGHALLLAAGQLVRVVAFLAGQTDRLQHLRHQGANRGAAGADHLQREGHVLPDRLVVEQLVVLEHEADRPPVLRHLTVGQTAQVVAGHADLAVRRLLLAQEQAQQRGLARARCTHQKHEVAAFHVQRDVVERGTRAPGVDLADMIKRDERHVQSLLLYAIVVRDYASASSAAARRCSWRQRMPASMNALMSPSNTAWVCEVSYPVRRSLTIWYGCST